MPAPGPGLAPGPPPRWLTAPDAVALEPAACSDTQGRVWVAWLDWTAEGVSLRVGVADAPSEFVLATETALARPQLAAHGDGVYCLWESRDAGRPVLRGRAVQSGPGGVHAPGAEHRVASNAAEADLTSTPDGAVQAAWIATDAGVRELRVGALEPGADTWEDTAVAQASAWGEPWAPRIAASPRAELYLVWDAWTGRDFDVFVARFADGEPATAAVLAGGPAHQASPGLALDPTGERLWVTWEETSTFGRGGALRAERNVRLCAVEFGTGARAQDGPPGATARDARFASRGAAGHYPRVAATERGVVLTARVLQRQRRRGLGVNDTNFSVWRTREVPLDPSVSDGGRPQLRESDGDNEETGTLLARGADVMFVAVADGRSASFDAKHGFDEPIEERWRLGLWQLRRAAWPELGAPRALEAPADATPVPEYGEARDGARLGDLHRHTHLSRCAGAQDGTLEDVWRYARGPGGLDFVSVTDHFQHLSPWAWWRTLREVERMDAPGRLVVLPGLERVVRGHGHQNLVYLEVEDARRDQAAHSLTGAENTALDPDAVVLVPHMMGSASNPFRWADVDPELHRLVEVYQGNRGSYEAFGGPHQAKDLEAGGTELDGAVRAGLHVGLIGASDHGASASGFALARADELTRASVFRALRERAVDAATDPVEFRVELGELESGAEGAASREAPLRVRAAARVDPARGVRHGVASVEVLKNGAPFAAERGAGAERVALTTRHRRATAERPLTVRVTGARLAGVTAHQAERPGLSARLADDGATAVLVNGGETLDAVLELGASATGAPLEDAVLDVIFGEQHQAVRLGAIPVGRSLRLDGLTPQLEYLWRLGPAVVDEEGSQGGLWSFPDEARAAGDSYRVRITWTDGAVAWSSPIRVTELQ